MRTCLAAAITVAMGLGALCLKAQQTAVIAQNDDAPIRATIDLYAKALKTGDLKAILSYWTADADFTDEDGKAFKGRDAIGKLFQENVKDLKAGKSALKIDSLRFLTPDVVTMNGAVEFTRPEGIVETNRFSAVLAKKDGRWLIASARDLPDLEGQAGDRGMKELQWLTGDWTAADRATKIKLSVRPELSGKFALMRYEIKGPKETLTVLQLLGYDPIQGALRSWAFDSRGGFGESLWSRENSVWTSESVGVLPSGQVGSAVNYIRILSPNSFTWQSTRREVEGQPIPDNELKYNRVTPKQ
jgi:uncharacterized protein (TIGR02246 family)